MALLAESTTHASSSKLHAQIDALTASAAEPFALETNRERFADRALRDVTVNSNDAALMLDPGNPLLVKEEMDAQKEYFRRLKFTYLEQEAKRNFLFSIMGDEPQGVQPGENEALEQSNAQRKAELKAFKAEVDNMRQESIRLAKENNSRREKVKQEISEAARLQKQIRDMELELARIKATHPPESRLTNAQAGALLDEQIAEMQRLTDATSMTNAKVEKTRDEVSSTTKEVKRLEREREREEARAKEVREGREAGDTKVDELCRWLSTSMQFYRSLLGISSVHASARGSSHLLHIMYDVPVSESLSKSANARTKDKDGSKEVELVLEFDPATKRLVNAELVGSDLDIQEIVGMSVGSNDVAGLVADVLSRLRPIQL